MRIDAKEFFDGWRGQFGKMTIGEVDGLNSLIAEMEGRGWTDPRWWAYLLATVYHETAGTMQPVREIGLGKGRKYGETYYGRGHVQLTWRKNYETMGRRLLVDLVNNPDLALDPILSAAICAEGMEHGLFTGKALADYFDADTDDPRNARRIVNGTDRAELIAGYHQRILPIIEASLKEEEPINPEIADLQARVANLEDYATLLSTYLKGIPDA